MMMKRSRFGIQVRKKLLLSLTIVMFDNNVQEKCNFAFRKTIISVMGFFLICKASTFFH